MVGENREGGKEREGEGMVGEMKDSMRGRC